MRLALTSFRLSIIASLLVIYGLGAPVLVNAELEEESLPRTGTLSGTYTGAFEGVSVPGVWGQDNNVLSDDKPPITGSVSQINRQEWKMRVFNNSEDDYSVTVKVFQFDKRKKKIKSDTFSYRLKAGENKERPVRAKGNTDTASLELVHWKNLTNRNKDKVVKEKK